MIGAREPPPGDGSPLRLVCSSTSRERRRGSRRGIGAAGLTRMATRPASSMPSIPKPSRRQSWRKRTSCSRPPRVAVRAASQTSSHAAARSTPCKTSSRLNRSLSSPITRMGAPSFKATRSQPPISPFTTNPSFSKKRLTGRYSVISRSEAPWRDARRRPSAAHVLTPVTARVLVALILDGWERCVGVRPGSGSVVRSASPCRHQGRLQPL